MFQHEQHFLPTEEFFSRGHQRQQVVPISPKNLRDDVTRLKVVYRYEPIFRHTAFPQQIQSIHQGSGKYKVFRIHDAYFFGGNRWSAADGKTSGG